MQIPCHNHAVYSFFITYVLWFSFLYRSWLLLGNSLALNFGINCFSSLCLSSGLPPGCLLRFQLGLLPVAGFFKLVSDSFLWWGGFGLLESFGFLNGFDSSFLSIVFSSMRRLCFLGMGLTHLGVCHLFLGFWFRNWSCRLLDGWRRHRRSFLLRFLRLCMSATAGGVLHSRCSWWCLMDLIHLVFIVCSCTGYAWSTLTLISIVLMLFLEWHWFFLRFGCRFFMLFLLLIVLLLCILLFILVLHLIMVYLFFFVLMNLSFGNVLLTRLLGHIWLSFSCYLSRLCWSWFLLLSFCNWLLLRNSWCFINLCFSYFFCWLWFGFLCFSSLFSFVGWSWRFLCFL